MELCEQFVDWAAIQLGEGSMEVLMIVSALCWFVVGILVTKVIVSRRRAIDVVKETDSEDYKMVLVIRKDKKLPSSAAAAMAAQAAVNVVDVVRTAGNPLWSAWISEWRERAVAKVSLQCPDEETFSTIVKAATSSMLPVAVEVVDAATEFATSKKVTAGTPYVAAIGPAPVNRVNTVTGSLKLY